MKRIFLLATIALALWGCSEERFIEEDKPSTGAVAYDPAKIITILTDMEQTRGTPILNATDIPDIGLFCSYTGTAGWTASDTPNKMFNTQLVQTSGAWTYTGTPVSWDAASPGDKYTFFAYSPYKSATNGIDVTSAETDAGIPTLTYNVPTTVADQPDLMVAVPKKDVNPYSTVPLQMKHALTCVEFKIAGNGEKVTDISITGVYMAGSLNMDASNMSWATSGSLSTTSLSALLNTDASGSYTTTPTMSTNLMKGNGYLMMVPQMLQAGAKVTVTYSNGVVLDFALTGSWAAGERRTYKITTEVMVSPEALVIPHTGTNEILHKIEVTTSNEDIKWILKSNDNWLLLGLDPDGSDKGLSVTAIGDQTVYTFAGENSTAANLTTTLTLNDMTDPAVNVTQLHASGGLNVLTDFYIGAFWRADEKGERILRNEDNKTPWIVTILWMDDNWAAGDIQLAAGLHSFYPNFAAVNSNPNNAESYPIPTADAKTSLSGTGEIEFRVGLKTKWSDNINYNATTAPARYAVLVLSYGTNYASQQKIYLRQGHEADYLMRNGDAATSVVTGWNGVRNKCVKFSPYNLTAPQYRSDAGGTAVAGGSSVTNHVQLDARIGNTGGGAFTEFPTQAGAFFQWVGATATVERRAYHPTESTSSLAGWNSSAPSAYWTFLSANNETCPPNWRRANDGSTSALVGESNNVADSEMRQSLWLNPQNAFDVNLDNSAWGYYADGYFDRRAIVASITGAAGSTVSPDSSTPAYRGWLFFNPETRASLFIPAAGYRSETDGRLIAAGIFASSWSSSANETLNGGWHFFALVHASHAAQGNRPRSFGYPIRCIFDPIDPIGPIDPSVTVDPYNPNPTDLE